MHSFSHDLSILTKKITTIGSFSKSALVGIVATLSDLFLLFVLVDLFSLEPKWANIPTLLLGVSIQFFGNKHLAFQSKNTSPWKEGLLFTIVEIGALLLNAGLFHLGAVQYQLPYLATRLAVGLLVYMFFSYPLWKGIFEKGEPYPTG